MMVAALAQRPGVGLRVVTAAHPLRIAAADDAARQNVSDDFTDPAGWATPVAVSVTFRQDPDRRPQFVATSPGEDPTGEPVICAFTRLEPRAATTRGRSEIALLRSRAPAPLGPVPRRVPRSGFCNTL
jgi:hypothetical protein